MIDCLITLRLATCYGGVVGKWGGKWECVGGLMDVFLLRRTVGEQCAISGK